MSEETGTAADATSDTVLPVTGPVDDVATEISGADVAPNTNNGVNGKHSEITTEGTRLDRQISYLCAITN